MLQERLAEAGVELRLHTQVLGVERSVEREGDRVAGVVLAIKSGLTRIVPPVAVDATGDADLVARGGWPFRKGGPVERAAVADDAYYPGATADQAITVLRAHAADNGAPPLFLGVGFCNTHLPWLAPERYWRLHDATDFGAGAGYDTSRPTPLAAELAVAGNEPFHETGLADRTVVVFTTDHGFALGEHRHWGKGMPWEPDLRVPLLLRTPDTAAGKRVTALTEHVDLLPTLLEQAGVEPPAWAEGGSLMPLLRDPAATGKPAVFSQARRGGLNAYSTRTAHHRYTRWLDAAGQVHAEEHYDHRSDPAETTNLAAHTDPSLLTHLRTLLPTTNRS